ncbi:hypothetical protein KAJ41_01225 [Candidatus Parcubacteria bacterium]|nr:hypothetical protein [Candidatus Parcubacteria bacterium]
MLIVPCVYEIIYSTKHGIPYIGLKIHEKALQKIKPCFRDNLLVDILTKELGLPAFLGKWSKDIGFGGILNRIEGGLDKDFITFVAQIPKVVKRSDDDCELCMGSGREQSFIGGECLSCVGSGKRFGIDWQEAYTISASFTVILKLLNRCQITTNATNQQLITVQTYTSNGNYGGALSGEVSFVMYNWLKSHEQEIDLSEACEASKLIFSTIFGLGGNSAHILIKKGIITVMHNDYGLYTEVDCEFHSHDTRTSGHQFILLAILAILQKMAK